MLEAILVLLIWAQSEPLDLFREYLVISLPWGSNGLKSAEAQKFRSTRRCENGENGKPHPPPQKKNSDIHGHFDQRDRFVYKS